MSASNPETIYKNLYRANLPAGVTFSAINSNYYFNGQRFNGINSVEFYRKYLFATTGFTSFSPSSFFGAGEQGVWFDPTDLATLFQASDGATSVTAAGQPSGLMLDKSRSSSFGSNIVVNGDFSGGSTGWTLGAGVTIAAGAAVFAAGSGFLQQQLATEAGRAYRVTGAASNFIFCGAWDRAGQQGALSLLSGGNSPTTRAAAFSFIFVATGTTSFIAFSGSAITLDNVTVVPLPLGNQATQATSAARPTYRVTGGIGHLEDDLVDDSINWTAPTGTYTVAWVDTAGNVTIQTAQSLSGATDALRAQRMVGYLAINRTLNEGETTNLTNWFRAKAGV